jgi:hypothetical protein
MVKAKEFMDYLCNKLEFRFFSGVPCSELQLLYNEMNSNSMHYIPAVTETIAIGIASGVWVSNIRSCVMMDSKKINSIKPIVDDISVRLEIPTLFIFGGDCKSDYLDITSLNKNYKKQLDDVVNYMDTKKLPYGVLIKEGFLS